MTRSIKPLRSGNFLLLVLCAALGIIAPCQAQGEAEAAAAAETTGLSPYLAKYKTSTRGMNITLTRELKRGADGEYTLTSSGKLIVAGVHEVSTFRVKGASIIPKSYIYQGTGLINRRREVHFTAGADTIRSFYKDNWYELPYTDKTLDRMSQQEQVRLLLLNDSTPKEDIKIRVADGKRVKNYILQYVGEEQISTPIGSFKTLHFERVHDDPERKSDMWIAPELSYLMVKTTHIEDGKATEVMLTEANVRGVN